MVRGRIIRTGFPISRARRELDRVFEEMFGDVFDGGSLWDVRSRLAERSWTPSLDVLEGEDEIIVKAEMPGVDPDELDISISDDFLVLSGEKQEEKEERKEDYYRAERRFGSFRRHVALPADVDRENVTADYADGILTVRLHKSPASQPKRIPVSVSKN